MDETPKKPSRRIPEKEREENISRMSLKELALYADRFYTSFSLERLYDEGKDEDEEWVLEFIKITHTYLKITGKGGLREAKEMATSFIAEKMEVGIKNKLVNNILIQAHKLGESGFYKNCSVKGLEEVLKMLNTLHALPVPVSSEPTPNTQLADGELNPKNCTELKYAYKYEELDLSECPDECDGIPDPLGISGILHFGLPEDS